MGPRGHERTKLERRFWAAVGSSAIGLGSKARWCCDCCGSRRGVAEGTACLSTRESFTRHRTLRKGSRRLRRGRSSGARALSVWARRSRRHSRENEKNELLRDTFQFLAGLGDVPITILADLNITPHLSLAMRSAFDVGGWADCAALVAEATASSLPATCYVHAGPGNRIDVVLANRISKHALCDVGLVGNTGIPRISLLPLCSSLQSMNKP